MIDASIRHVSWVMKIIESHIKNDDHSPIHQCKSICSSIEKRTHMYMIAYGGIRAVVQADDTIRNSHAVYVHPILWYRKGKGIQKGSKDFKEIFQYYSQKKKEKDDDGVRTEVIEEEGEKIVVSAVDKNGQHIKFIMVCLSEDRGSKEQIERDDSIMNISLSYCTKDNQLGLVEEATKSLNSTASEVKTKPELEVGVIMRMVHAHWLFEVNINTNLMYWCQTQGSEALLTKCVNLNEMSTTKRFQAALKDIAMDDSNFRDAFQEIIVLQLIPMTAKRHLCSSEVAIKAWKSSAAEKGIEIIEKYLRTQNSLGQKHNAKYVSRMFCFIVCMVKKLRMMKQGLESLGFMLDLLLEVGVAGKIREDMSERRNVWWEVAEGITETHFDILFLHDVKYTHLGSSQWSDSTMLLNTTYFDPSDQIYHKFNDSDIKDTHSLFSNVDSFKG